MNFNSLWYKLIKKKKIIQIIFSIINSQATPQRWLLFCAKMYENLTKFDKIFIFAVVIDIYVYLFV
jgi:hypothetical protein